MAEYMADPTAVLKEYLRSIGTRADNRSFQLGQLAMALEMVTLIRSLEALPVVSDLGRQEAITALHTLLVEQKIEDTAYEWYDRLSASRRPRFVPGPLVVTDERVPRGIAAVVAPADEDHPLPRVVGALSFQIEDRPDESSPPDSSDAKHQAHRSQHYQSTYELSELTDEEG